MMPSNVREQTGAMAVSLAPILTEASQTRRHLRDLCNNIASKITANALPDGVEADHRYLTDCVDRFNIWAGSLGVFQKGDASLDARLSNHILGREVLRLLKQLDTVTSDLRDIINGDREQHTWTKSSAYIPPDGLSDTSSWSDDEADDIPTPETRPEDEDHGSTDLNNKELITESKDLHLLIGESITSLLRLSAQVHRSSRKTKFAKSSIDKHYEIGPDISHVRDFFPHLDTTGNTALAERLGKANAQRRQWLWYRRRHREKLSVDLSGASNESMPPSSEWAARRNARGADEDTKSIALFSTDEESPGSTYNPSLISGTKASTFRSHHSTASFLMPPSTAPPDTLYDRSSRAADSEEKLLVPEPPRDLVLGQPHSCRYCCKIIEISGRHAWQRHVHSDLSSYTCLAEGCGELFFESRKKWWAHEIEAHRKIWACGICHVQLPNISATRQHIREVHEDQVGADQVDDVANKFGRPTTSFHASECPLCDYPSLLRQRGLSEEEIANVSVEKFGRHLGRHLEQLALFVLPNTDLINENDVSDAERETGGQSDSDDDSSDSGPPEPLSEPELMQKLSDIISLQLRCGDPEELPGSPDLAMRWQPPQDFTPPLEDFDAEDADSLPTRQEPMFGGDLHTPGWARGTESRKEGFCARCPISHWVNITDGSYRFHLTYLHGVPDTGVPLPRPSTIRPVQGRPNVWEGFCDACSNWKVLKKTVRGWNWYRHWLNDHSDIVKNQTEAVRNGADAKSLHHPPAGVTVKETTSKILHSSAELDEILRQRPHLVQDRKFTSLHLAHFASQGNADAVGKLLTRLMKSCSEDELRTLANTRRERGETLLMVSAAQGLESVVRQLLDLGADPNITVGPGQETALDLAADAGYFSIVEQLIIGGADASQAHVLVKILSNEREYAGENTAAGAGKQETSGSASRINLHLLGPLGLAAFRGDMAATTKLLGGNSSGPSLCDIEEGAAVGCAPFLLASMQSRFEIMDLLLTHGANINITSKHGWTPLMLASQRGDERCVKWLIERGADANHLSPDRWTALAEATNNGFTQIMALLLAAGADPEIRAQSDWAPLMHAAYRGDIKAVDMLLEVGASFEEISAHDETVMLLAAAAGSAVVVKRLLDAGCPPDPVWSRTAISQTGSEPQDQGDAKDVANVPKLQERIERAYKVGWTPLMVASQIGSLEIVTMLLDAGANSKPKSPMFKTALEIAKENGKSDVVEYLERWLGEEGH